MRKILYATLLFLLTQSAFCAIPSKLAASQQLVLVKSSDWNDNHATLQRYQRDTHHQWEKIGAPIPVMIGKNGTAWGVDQQGNNDLGPIKKEGDGRTPVGIYTIGPLFGFAAQPEKTMHSEYFPLTDTSICVDDVKSVYYNQLLDSAKVPTPDWNSGEKMLTVPGYKWGSQVQYNSYKPVVGAGSCIFIHIWKGQDMPTTGCVAMDENNLLTVLNWLNRNKKPVLLVIPAPAFKELQSSWKLP